MSTVPATPRLSIILAREAPLGVIVYRGPSEWCQIICWNTESDQFEDGAWFHGRIYPEACDLSPQGSLLLYGALKHGFVDVDAGYTRIYTAISRPPWLFSLALWPADSTYDIGGGFNAEDEIFLRAPTAVAHPNHSSEGIRVVGESRVPISRPHPLAEEWEGMVNRDREVYVSGGCLFQRTRSGNVLIRDFRGRKPVPVPAPEWARRPL